MKTQTKALVVGSMTAFIGSLPATVFAAGKDHDKDHKDSTCYAVREVAVDATTNSGPPLIIRYLTDHEGSLSSEEESREFGHLKQRAFSVVGKAAALFHETNDVDQQTNTVDGQFRLMTTVDGTIITGKDPFKNNSKNATGSPDNPGAHMGLDVQFLRFLNGVLAIGPFTLECTSREIDKTPDRWICNVKGEFQTPGFFNPVFGLTLPIALDKVNPREVEACSVFQDTGGALPIESPPDGEPPTIAPPTTPPPTTPPPTTPPPTTP